jgi:predicted RNase H-like HicB family nuclease
MKMMNSDGNQAEDLASRPYLTIVFRDSTTEDEPVFVALNPELEGCVAQGDTSNEARENLGLIRKDYIQHLLEHDLRIPEPGTIDNVVIFMSMLSADQSGSESMDELSTNALPVYASLHSA